MTITAAFAGRHLISACLLSALTLAAYAPCAIAQPELNEAKPADNKPAATSEPQEYRTFYLSNTMAETENDIVTDLRNMLPRARVYRVGSQGAVSILGTADELQLAQRIIGDLDRPVKTYRLSFTIKESDAGKTDEPRNVSVVVALGNKSAVKLGSKIPIMTGSYDTQSPSPSNTQYQYEDIGLGIEAWLDSSGNEMRLRTKVSQSSVASERSNVGIQDPILHETVFDGQANLVEGKPTVLGTLEMPGGTGSEEIEVVAEAVK